MPNNDLFTNDVMTFRLIDSYYMLNIVLCSCHVCVGLNHKIGLILFAICAYLNEYVASASYQHVNIANPIKINNITTLYLKSIINTYCKLSNWCVVSSFPSCLQDLI